MAQHNQHKTHRPSTAARGPNMSAHAARFDPNRHGSAACSLGACARAKNPRDTRYSYYTMNSGGMQYGREFYRFIFQYKYIKIKRRAFFRSCAV